MQESPVPREALRDGKIEFSWTGGSGECGSPVAEVWLMKQPSETFAQNE